jgi:hypothetical protein
MKALGGLRAVVAVFAMLRVWPYGMAAVLQLLVYLISIANHLWV